MRSAHWGEKRSDIPLRRPSMEEAGTVAIIVENVTVRIARQARLAFRRVLYSGAIPVGEKT